MKTFAALLALPLLLGCATPPEPGAGLAGSKWTFTAIDGAAPKSDRARLEFLPDRISASAGCNGLGGEYTIKDGRLMTGPFMSTMMYCDGLMEQERALSQLLEAKPSHTLTGNRLVLQGGGHKAELVRAD